jgi:hypothetical protein
MKLKIYSLHGFISLKSVIFSIIWEMDATGPCETLLNIKMRSVTAFQKIIGTQLLGVVVTLLT